MKIASIKTGPYSERPMARVRLFVNVANVSVAEWLFARATGKSLPIHKEYRKLLPLIKIDLCLPANVKASWSQKAGCGCGCSPGFLLDVHPDKVGYQAVWVTIK
jgi:hypothetical protein